MVESTAEETYDSHPGFYARLFGRTTVIDSQMNTINSIIRLKTPGVINSQLEEFDNFHSVFLANLLAGQHPLTPKKMYIMN